MKKEDLCATLHQVQPDEALIRRTLNEIHKQKEPQTRRRPPYAFGYRLAGALCALALVIGIGATVADFPISNKPDDLAASPVGIPSSGTFSYDTSGETDPLGKVAVDSAVEELRVKAADLQSDWILLQGSLQDIYFRSVENGVSVCAIAIQVTKVWETDGEGIPEQAEKTIAVIRFTDETEMERFPDLMGSEICVVLMPNADGEDTLEVAEYLFCE